VTTGQPQAAALQQRLRQVADLVDEYAESAWATANGDLMILLFQIRMVLGDDPAEAGRRISGTRMPPT
jgi:hypothetical protein